MKAKQYVITEESDLGQYILEISGLAGSLLEREITKTELLDVLSYIIRSARDTKNEIKTDKNHLDEFEVKEE